MLAETYTENEERRNEETKEENLVPNALDKVERLSSYSSENFPAIILSIETESNENYVFETTWIGEFKLFAKNISIHGMLKQ